MTCIAMLWSKGDRLMLYLVLGVGVSIYLGVLKMGASVIVMPKR